MGLEIGKNKVNIESYAKKKIASVSSNTHLIPAMESLRQETATDLRSSAAHTMPLWATQHDSVLNTAMKIKAKWKVQWTQEFLNKIFSCWWLINKGSKYSIQLIFPCVWYILAHMVLRAQTSPMSPLRVNIKVPFKGSLALLSRFTHIYNCDPCFIAANFILKDSKKEERCVFCHILLHCLHAREMVMSFATKSQGNGVASFFNTFLNNLRTRLKTVNLLFVSSVIVIAEPQ